MVHMKRLILSALLLLSAASLWARPEEPRLLAQAEGGLRMERAEDPHARLSKDERREARRQWLNSRQAEREEGAPGLAPGEERRRLSPEERQRLRRDVHEAGREFYPREERRPLYPEGLPQAPRSPRHP